MPSLADFGTALPEGASVSDAEREAIIKALVEARDHEEANRCTVSMEPLLVDGKAGPDGIVAVVEAPGTKARQGAQVRVNMYTVSAAQGWYCVERPVDPIINLPVRSSSHVLLLTALEGPLCPNSGVVGGSAQSRPHVRPRLASAVVTCNADRISEYREMATYADICEPDGGFGRTVLHSLTQSNCLDGARLLLPRVDDACVGVQDRRGFTVLHEAVIKGMLRLVHLLLPHMDHAAVNARISTSLHGASTALGFAILQGYSGMVRALLVFTEDEELSRPQRSSRRTLLHTAAQDPMGRSYVDVSEDSYDKPAIIRMLLERMDDDAVLAQDVYGWNALHMAVATGELSVVEALASGMSPGVARAHDGGGMTALHLAAGYGETEKLHSLLAAIPDDDFLGARTLDGQTALHLAMVRQNAPRCNATCESQVRLVGELLERMNRSAASARYIDAEDQQGATALIASCASPRLPYAASTGHTNSVRALLRYMSNESVAVADRTGSTALHHAARRGLERLVDPLLARMDSASIRAQDFMGRTALHHAAMSKNMWMVGSISTRMDRAAIDLKNHNGTTALETAQMMGDDASAARIMLSWTLAS